MKQISRKLGAPATASKLALLLICLLGASTLAAARPVQVTLDRAQTTINIFVHDVHGGVHGTFKLKSGAISFNPETGEATGEVVVDAASGDTGNDSRDRKMHKDVLESGRYPEITFLPKRVTGFAAQGSSIVHVQGVFRIHGADHELTLEMPVQVSGDRVTGNTTFSVPYQSWGMKNPSILFLRVDGTAQVSVSAVGHITAASEE